MECCEVVCGWGAMNEFVNRWGGAKLGGGGGGGVSVSYVRWGGMAVPPSILDQSEVMSKLSGGGGVVVSECMGCMGMVVWRGGRARVWSVMSGRQIGWQLLGGEMALDLPVDRVGCTLTFDEDSDSLPCSEGNFIVLLATEPHFVLSARTRCSQI